MTRKKQQAQSSARKNTCVGVLVHISGPGFIVIIGLGLLADPLFTGGHDTETLRFSRGGSGPGRVCSAPGYLEVGTYVDGKYKKSKENTTTKIKNRITRRYSRKKKT